MTKINRRPTRAAVARALREISILWRPPDKEKAAGAGTQAAFKTTHANHFSAAVHQAQCRTRIPPYARSRWGGDPKPTKAAP